MSFENPASFEPTESYEELYKKALEMAQRMSVKWNQLPKTGIEADRWQAAYSDIANIFNLNEGIGGKTGLQKFFEERVGNFEKNNENEESGARRLIIELDRLSESLDHAIEFCKQFK